MSVGCQSDVPPPYTAHTDLHCKPSPNALDAIEHVYTLVDRDAVGFAGGHALEEAAASTDVEDDGDVGVGDPGGVYGGAPNKASVHREDL